MTGTLRWDEERPHIMKNDGERLKVLAINGSPRKNGNTATLLKEIGEIAKKRGDKVEQIDLIDLDFSDCRECMGCKKGTECVTDDDMQGIYKKMQEADVILLGSPIFMDAETGLTKNMIDRTFALLAPREDGTFETRLRKGKKGTECVTDDDMQGIYKKMQEADVILLGSPIFMDAETGLTKNMIDRTFALLAPREDGTFETRLRGGKKAFVVFTCGMNDGEIIYHKLTTRYFDTFVTMLGCKDFRSFIIPGTAIEVNVLERPATKTVLEEASRFFGAE